MTLNCPLRAVVLSLFACLAVVGCRGPSLPASPLPPNPIPESSSTLNFESGAVRPLALSADGNTLYAINLPDGYLEVLAVGGGGLSLQASVPVGVSPVAVAVRTPTEVWVVNQLSDSVSVVDVGSQPPRVVRTLWVGDEPGDIVFAGPGQSRAFITTAHRGQRRGDPALQGIPGAGDPQLTTPGVGRADVWVFDATSESDLPLAIVTLPGDTPRALAATPDGSRVYAAIYRSGNQTTVTSSALPCAGWEVSAPCTVDGVQVPGSPLGPGTNHAGIAAPRVGVIVKEQTDGSWRDADNRDWSSAIRFTLPDMDVFQLDASTLATTASYAHVGTTLFNLAVNPVSGSLYVSNTEARNDLRFEGPGTFYGSSLQGHLAEARITTIVDGAVLPRHLNKHIPYQTLPAPPGVKDHSLSAPLGMAVSADGGTLYVAAMGSSKVGVFATAALENDSFDPNVVSADYLAVSGGGPTGVVLDSARNRLYVATRFDNGLSTLDLQAKQETGHVLLHTPEPASVVQGRRFLYDATVASSNGEASCASCHMFGDTDQLSWDLGNPDADPVFTPIHIKLGTNASSTINGTGDVTELHPIKGAMGTQTLRGLVNHGTMHWRGDRADGFFGRDTHTAPPYDSELAFKNFIVAFQSLVGLGQQFDADNMQSFSDFALALTLPPNPNRALDNSLTDSQAQGRSYYMGCDGLDSISGKPVVCDESGHPTTAGHFSDGAGQSATSGFTCNGCHTLAPVDGYFGTDGEMSFEGLPQTMKIPQLRNLYERVGMFGEAPNDFENGGETSGLGAQIRGFGFTNDASTDTLFRFLESRVFEPTPNSRVGFTGGDAQRRNVEQFLLAFDNDLAPIVGQQATLDAASVNEVSSRIDLLETRAAAPFASKILGGTVTECDLVAQGVVNGHDAAFLRQADGTFLPDDGSTALSDAALRTAATATGAALTFTCLPPGWGRRAIDRDLDGVLNGQDGCPADATCR